MSQSVNSNQATPGKQDRKILKLMTPDLELTLASHKQAVIAQ